MHRWSALSETTRDLLVAGGWFALGAVIYLAGLDALVTIDSAAPRAPLSLRFALLAALCAVLVFRRRAPICTLLAGLVPVAVDLALQPTLSIWLAYTDLIYAAVVYSSRRQMRGVVITWLTLSVLVVGTVLAVTGEWRVAALALVLAVAFVGTSLWSGLSVRAYKAAANAERARAEALSRVAELDRRAAVADERKAMARDLHDVIAGHLSAIALQSEAALTRYNGAEPPLHGILDSIRSNSVDALQEMRTMIELLRGDAAADADTRAPGRLGQLTHLVQVAREAGLPAQFRDRTGGTDVDGAVDQAAYRIVQEALTNAMKHAPGQEVDIDVHTDHTELVIAIGNGLPSGPPEPVPREGDTGRRGLSNMRERAAALGGRLCAGPEQGSWWVHARLPLSAAHTSLGERE